MSCLESFFGWKKPKSGRKNGSIIYHSNTDTTVESGRTAEELLEELTQLTIVGFAKAAETKDTALHVACEYHYSDDLIINVLLDGDPDSTFKENGNGDLPLHLAMKDAKQCDENNEQNGASEKVVEALLSKNKRAVEHLNHSDCLPIHIACDKNNGTANEFIIKRLLDIYPDSVMMHCKLKKTLDATNIYDDEDEELLTSTNLNESKSGLYSYFMDSVDTLREAFLKPSCNRRDTNGEDDGIESNLTPLHLAVMNNLSPDIISSLLNANSYCLNLETSEGRTAMDIAKSTPNADGSIEVMKSYNKNVTKLLGLKVVSQALIDATADEILKGNVRLDEPAREKKDPKMLWKKASIAVRFINTLTASVFALNEMDNDESMMAPTDYKPPDNLEFECVDITLPVGFRQLRQGLLSNESPFYKQFHENNMNFSEWVNTVQQPFQIFVSVICNLLFDTILINARRFYFINHSSDSKRVNGINLTTKLAK